MGFIKRADPQAALPITDPGHVPAGIKTLPTITDEQKRYTNLIQGRDYAAEARGKTRCALEEAWAQSPLLPMLVKDPNDRAELHLILDEIVTERMKRVFPNG